MKKLNQKKTIYTHLLLLLSAFDCLFFSRFFLFSHNEFDKNNVNAISVNARREQMPFESVRYEENEMTKNTRYNELQ